MGTGFLRPTFASDLRPTRTQLASDIKPTSPA